MPGVSGVTVVTNARVYYTPRAAAGASGARHSPCPLNFREHDFTAKLARIVRRDRELVTSGHCQRSEDSILCLCGEMDCVAEPVIGRAFARPVGSQ
jgi:hypothetical protein